MILILKQVIIKIGKDYERLAAFQASKLHVHNKVQNKNGQIQPESI